MQKEQQVSTLYDVEAHVSPNLRGSNLSWTIFLRPNLDWPKLPNTLIFAKLSFQTFISSSHQLDFINREWIDIFLLEKDKAERKVLFCSFRRKSDGVETAEGSSKFDIPGWSISSCLWRSLGLTFYSVHLKLNQHLSTYGRLWKKRCNDLFVLSESCFRKMAKKPEVLIFVDFENHTSWPPPALLVLQRSHSIVFCCKEPFRETYQPFSWRPHLVRPKLRNTLLIIREPCYRGNKSPKPQAWSFEWWAEPTTLYLKKKNTRTSCMSFE